MNDAPEPLLIWTIYDSPTDFPGRFVVRCFPVRPGAVSACQGAYICGSLEEARAYVPPGSLRFGRATRDDPSIVECWI